MSGADHEILDYDRLATRWGVDPDSLKNQYSRDPASLPTAIRLPCCRGPRWRIEDVRGFEIARQDRPETPRRTRGRPRIHQGARS